MPDCTAPSGFVSRLQASPVIPVVTITDPAVAGDLARAIREGGLNFLEITLRSREGLTAITRATGAGLTIGAGTVITAAQAKVAIGAGAEFIVCPGFDAEVVQLCVAAGVPVVPGVATPTELMVARAAGVGLAKVFPARELGGPGYVRALSAVFPDQLFLPTGGVEPESAPDYLSIASVVAVGGSWITPSASVAARDWDAITGLALSAAKMASELR